MSKLEIRLFGGLRANLDGKRITPLPTLPASGLLAYLALNKGRLLHRDVITGALWPEEPDQRARKNLRNALWAVRSRVELDQARDGKLIRVAGPCVGLSATEEVWSDVAEFDQLFGSTWPPHAGWEEMERLERCVSLYGGGFMEGFYFPWCSFERERLHLAFLACLERLLVAHLNRQEWPVAIQRGRAVLRHDPLREHVHRLIMICHYSMGNRPLAVRQYHECVRILKDEMGLAPMETTEHVFQEIVRGSLRVSGEIPVRRSISGENRDLKLRDAIFRAEEAFGELRRLARIPLPPSLTTPRRTKPTEKPEAEAG